MRGIRWMLLCLVLCLMSGCAQQTETSPYQLYFTVGENQIYGESIVGEDYFPEDGEVVTVVRLLQSLLAGPDTPGLSNPFPTGTRLLWAEWQEGGILRVNLSEEYGGLTGIALTQADYCIVYTLSQISGVDGVEILSANQQNQFRNHQILRVEDILIEGAT